MLICLIEGRKTPPLPLSLSFSFFRHCSLASLSQPGVSQTRVAISVAAILTGDSDYLPLRIELSSLPSQIKALSIKLVGDTYR
jgi:hypothetical protein